jgi:dethiobiotin synthetase
VHEPRYVFGKSLSPHAAAALAGRSIDIEELIKPPLTAKDLIIELAGGLLVPLSDTSTNLDLLTKWRFPVIVVSKHYLGSINHTLLTIAVLKSSALPIAGIVFNGEELPDTERIIAKMAGVPILGRIPLLESVTATTVRSLSEQGIVAVDRL